MSDEGFLTTMNNMIEVAAHRPYLRGSVRVMDEEDGNRVKEHINIPREDVLGVVVAEVHLGGSPVGNTTCLIVDHPHELRFCYPLATMDTNGPMAS